MLPLVGQLEHQQLKRWEGGRREGGREEGGREGGRDGGREGGRKGGRESTADWAISLLNIL